MLKYILFTLSAGLCFLIFSCKKDVSEPSNRDIGKLYTPMESGSVWIYSVDSIGFGKLGGGGTDTIRYDVKFHLTDSFVNLSNENFQVCKTYKRYDTSEAWRPTNAQLWLLSNDYFLINADNSRTVHVSFPLEQFKTWDGNAFNSGDVERFEIISFDVGNPLYSSFTDSTLFVEQKRNENEVDSVLRTELYGKRVGLLEKRQTNLKLSQGQFIGLKLTARLQEFNQK